MKPTWPRFSVRTLMLVVGLSGLIVFGAITAMRLGPRARSFQSRAIQWRTEAERQRSHLVLCRNEVERTIRAAKRLRSGGYNIHQAELLTRRNAEDWLWWRTNQAHSEEMIAYCGIMEQKYQQAARFPWLNVAVDPPVPYWSRVTGPVSDEQAESIGREDGVPDCR